MSRADPLHSRSEFLRRTQSSICYSYNMLRFTAAAWLLWTSVNLGLQDISTAGEALGSTGWHTFKCNIISRYLAKGFVKCNLKACKEPSFYYFLWESNPQPTLFHWWPPSMRVGHYNTPGLHSEKIKSTDLPDTSLEQIHYFLISQRSCRFYPFAHSLHTHTQLTPFTTLLCAFTIEICTTTAIDCTGDLFPHMSSWENKPQWSSRMLKIIVFFCYTFGDV